MVHFLFARPILIAVLCVLAIAYRFYSAFLAARVATLDDMRTTPAVLKNDGVNFHPTNKWVLFGHHFAAISGAGPLIGPVLAAQFGYLPGLLWIVIGVCLAGAVQDFLVMTASVRRGGKSLAQIAFSDIGKVAGSAAMIAILFILVVAMAGLGKVVVNALGGEHITYPAGSAIIFPNYADAPPRSSAGIYSVPPGSTLMFNNMKSGMALNEAFELQTTSSMPWFGNMNGKKEYTIPAGSYRLVPGSSWGIFTISCTIPIALLIGFYMVRVRKGKVMEASIIGAVLTLAATIAGGYIGHHRLGDYLNMTQSQVLLAMAIYGLVAAVLPVWVLLVPRDYLSSFLKIGTIALLVIGVIIANPKMQAPAINHTFISGGPVVPGKIFPFLFITIMCGAISGFHALVSSGTTSKMLRKETDARMIGYGAMLMEGLVGVVAMIAAATLPVGDYYALNTKLADVPAYHDQFAQIPGGDIDQLAHYEDLTQESLRGRTGGGVTLAVGMAAVFDQAFGHINWLWKYWYHFAIMFEALFILTTIDAGTRIGRFLFQELLGRAIHPKLADVKWWPAALVSTAVIVLGWAYLINSSDFAAIWAMFGVSNQMLAVIALAVVSVWLVNEGRAKFLWVTVAPLIVVLTTTSTAAVQLLTKNINTLQTLLAKPVRATADLPVIRGCEITASLLGAMMICTFIILAAGAWRIAKVPKSNAQAAIT